MSEYKIRIQRRRRKNYAPYLTRKEQGIVSRMWSWLAPSSWWQGASSEPSPSPPPSPPSHHPSPPSHHPSPPSHHPSPPSHPSPPASNDNPPSLTPELPPSSKPQMTSLQPHLMTSSQPQMTSLQPHLMTSSQPQMTSSQRHLMITEPCQPLVGTDMEQRPVNGMERDEDSGGSWVAEDTGHQSVTEYAVQRLENPAFAAPPRHAPSSSSRMRYGSGFTTRVMRSRPLLTSTPQLSPVNEANEQGPPHYSRETAAHHNDSVTLSRHSNQVGSQTAQLPSIPEQSPHHTVKSVFHTTPSISVATASRARNYTDLSLSRSPFQSPFYSGRTAYGGAASGQRLNTAKRRRRESSPPVLAPVQMTVTARPHPSVPPLSSLPLSSSTARKILHTLDSLSSPLADARKLPLRAALATDRQPARKRHKSAYTALPPPVASLSTPSLNPPSLTPPTLTPAYRGGPVFVPNEKSLRHSTTTTQGQSSLLGATLRPKDRSNSSTHTSPLATSGGQRSSPPVTCSPLHTAPLSVKQPLSASSWLSSAPPPVSVSPDHSSTPRAGMMSTLSFTPVSSPSSSSPLATSGGKMRHSQLSRTHFSHRHDNQDRETIPVAMVPAVGLKIGNNNSPSFGFAHALIPQEPTAAATEVVKATRTPPNFSFSTPTPFSSDSSSHQVPSKKLSSSFQFSAPKPCTPTKTCLQATPPSRQATPPSQQTASLKTGSVVDVLKQPDYRALFNRALATERDPTGGKEMPALPTSTGFKLPPLLPIADQPPSFIFQSGSGTHTQPATTTTSSRTAPAAAMVTTSPPSLLTSALATADGWECDSCLVQNKKNDVTCDACGSAKSPPTSSEREVSTEQRGSTLSLLTQFAPSSDSWECSVCMVQNRATDAKCVACAAPKPGSGSGEPTSAKGGLQLGTGIRPGGEGSLALVGGASSPPQTSTEALKPLAQFAPPEGSWSCETCMVDNSRTSSVCVACGTARPGSAEQQTPPTVPAGFGAGGGMKLSKSSQEGLKLSGGGLKLGEGGLKFGSGGGLKLGEGGLKIDGGGLKFGSGGGLKLGEGGLKFGSGGDLKLGEGGLNFCSGGFKGDKDSTELAAATAVAPTTATVSSTGTSLKVSPNVSTSMPGIKFGSMSSTPAFSLGQPSLPAGQPGSSVATTKAGPDMFSGGLPTAVSLTASSGAPTFSFGGTPSTTASSAARLSFGAVSAPTLFRGSHSTTSSTASSLSFGSTAPSLSSNAPSLSFSTNAAPTFSFGAASSTAPGLSFQAASSTAPSLSFQAASSSTAPSLSFQAASSTAPSLSFQAASSTAPGLSFQAASSSTAPGLSFGSTTATSTPSLSFGVAPPTTSSSTSTTAPTFLFGAASSSTASSGMQFGSGMQQQPPSGGQTTGQATLFNFSGANPSTGQSSISTEFGSPSHPRFGSPSQPRFGSPSQPQFGSPSQPRFGSPSQPKLNFTGASTDQTIQAGFNFSASRGSPSLSFGGSSSSAQPTSRQSTLFTAGVAPATQGGGRVIRRARRRGPR